MTRAVAHNAQAYRVAYRVSHRFSAIPRPHSIWPSACAPHVPISGRFGQPRAWQYCMSASPCAGMRSTHDGRQGWAAVAGAVHVNIPRFAPSTASRGFGHPTAPHQLGAAPMKRAHRPRSAQFHAHLRSARLVMRLAAFTSALALILWAAWPGTHAQASPCPRLVVQRPMLRVMPCNVT